MPPKPTLLFASPEPAWLGRLGSHQRMNAIIRLLSNRYDVIKLAIGRNFRNMGPPEDWIIIDYALGSLFQSPVHMEQLMSLIRDKAIEVVYCNYFFFGPLARALPETVRKICDIHDIQHLRAERFGAAGETAPCQVSKRVELAELEAFDKLVSINPNETKYLESNIRTPVVTIPHIAPFRALVFKEHRYPMVVGSYAKANQDGIRTLLIPAVRDNMLDSIVLMAGGISRLASEDTTGRIIPMGPFNSPEDIYPFASVALAPLRIGGGLKIKVIEALVHGVPVAGTGCALDGIPETHPDIFFRFETPEDLRGLVDFLESVNPPRIREFAEEYYSPEKYIDLIEF